MNTYTNSVEPVDLFRLAEKAPWETALRSDNGLEELTYGELTQILEKFSDICQERGVVFCLCENEPGAVAGYLGIMAANMVPLMLDSKIGYQQLQKMYQAYQPAYLWVPAEWIKDCPLKGLRLILEECGYELWRTDWNTYPLHEELALLLATSGSTGDAKLVRLSRTNIYSNAEAIVEYLHIDEKERPITSLPLNYTYGLSVINSHLLAGACILMTKASYVQRKFWEFAEQEQATSFSGVPYTYEILKKIHFFREGNTCLKTITQAGGKLSEQLQKEVAEWAAVQGIRFYVMYGQTEATARMGYLPPEDVLNRIGSLGRAIPGGAFCLMDEEGNEIKATECTGELIYKGPNVSMGYASDKEDLALGDDNHGILHTGDLAKRDCDGYYYIVGRKKRFVKIYGVRVSLDACEALLRERYPDVELACAGEDDHLCIYVADKVFKQDKDAGTQEIHLIEKIVLDMADMLSEFLHLNRRGFDGKVVEAIPKNASGKILYQQLKMM